MKKYDDSQTIWSVTIIDNLSSHFFIQRGDPWKKKILVIFRKKFLFMCYNYMAHGRYHLVQRWMKVGQSEKGKGIMAHFTPLISIHSVPGHTPSCCIHNAKKVAFLLSDHATVGAPLKNFVFENTRDLIFFKSPQIIFLLKPADSIRSHDSKMV